MMTTPKIEPQDSQADAPAPRHGRVFVLVGVVAALAAVWLARKPNPVPSTRPPAGKKAQVASPSPIARPARPQVNVAERMAGKPEGLTEEEFRLFLAAEMAVLSADVPPGMPGEDGAEAPLTSGQSDPTDEANREPPPDPADLAPILSKLIATSRSDLAEECLQRNWGLVSNAYRSSRPGTRGQSLLHRALALGDDRLAALLLSIGANVNASDAQGQTPLDVAVQSHPDRPDLLELLFHRPAEGRFENVYRALEVLLLSGRRELVSTVLAGMGTVDYHRDPKGLGLMHYAAQRGHGAMIDLLIAHGATLGIVTWQGQTPLHLAVTTQSDATAATARLLRARPDVNRRDLLDRTPLYLAAASGAPPAVLELLLSAGAKADRPGDHDLTPLLLVVARRDFASMEVLLRHGADPNQRDRDGRTVLHLAAIAGDMEMAKFMLAHGSGTRMRDNQRMLARVYAGQRGHPEISDLILAHEAAKIEAAKSRPDVTTFPEQEPKRLPPEVRWR